MKAFYSILAIVLTSFFATSSTLDACCPDACYRPNETEWCDSWWSLINYKDLITPGEYQKPVRFLCNNPDSDLSCLLSPQQMAMCNRDSGVLSTIAIGVLRALSECQKLFKDRPWNCSVFECGPFLGNFMRDCTKETAFVQAIISAGIAREVARKCKHGELDKCGCDYSVSAKVDQEVTIFGGCGDNCDHGVGIAEKFTDSCFENSDTAKGLASLHNYKVGRELVRNTSVRCICHGVSGSCTVQTCFKNVPDMHEIGVELQTKYDDYSFQVQQSAPSTITVINSGSTPNTSQLVHTSLSPNFCRADLCNGVYGTANRQCLQGTTNQSSCATMCCGRQPVSKVVTKCEECCDFVWCCRVECKPCKCVTVIEHYCQTD